MKIVSLSPSATEILFALGLGKKIVANTYLCDYPEEAKTKLKIGSWTDIHMEKLEDLEPTVIFTSTVVQERLAHDLKKKGYAVHHSDPRSLKDVYDDIKKIATLLRKEKEAKMVIETLKDKEMKLLEYTQHSTSPQPCVYVEEWYSPPMVSGNWVPDIIRLSGGIYDWVRSGDISREVTDDEVRKNNPDVILLAYCGFGKNSDVSKILNRKGWQDITAIKEKKVFAVDENILNRPGPRLLQVAEDIQKILKGCDSID